MARRLALADARLQGPRLPLSIARPSLLRFAARGTVVVVALVAAYVVARETSVFAVREVSVAAASPAVEEEVRAALVPFTGTSLVKVDAAAVEERLEEIPSVRTAEVDRAFPHTIAVGVELERPVAVVRLRTGAWVVSERGRVIRPVELGAERSLPRIWLAKSAPLVPGETLGSNAVRPALHALAGLPPRFPARVVSARSREGSVVLVLDGWTELRLGPPERIGIKLASAATVLRALPEAERRQLAYLDVSLPERPVALEKPQPSTEG